MSQPAALCMPLLKTPVELTTTSVLVAWSEVWPGRPEPSNIEVKAGGFTCEVEAVQVSGMLMPTPIPNDEVWGPASTTWLWPGAANDLLGYGAHVVIFASQAGSQLAAFQAMTRTAAAVVRASNGLGVYMGGAGTVIRSDVFVRMAQDMEVPVPLWIDLRCVRTQEGGAGLFTVGLQQFDLMEIEIPSSHRQCGDLRIWTTSIASWLIETRPTIRAGETVGLSAEERVLVEHAESLIKREGPVMRLVGA